MMFWNRKKKNEQAAKTLTQDDVRKLIIDLRLPRIILELFDENLTDGVANSHFLSDEYKPPYSFFGNPMEHRQLQGRPLRAVSRFISKYVFCL
jgi:hypothetical protein